MYYLKAAYLVYYHTEYTIWPGYAFVVYLTNSYLLVVLTKQMEEFVQVILTGGESSEQLTNLLSSF
jgi:hypothetical protein